MAVIPPWISVSPRDFLAAAEAGASTGLQVANLRQRGALESARLAQAAAEAAARRSSAEAQHAQSLGFQRWEREMMDQARAAALAQQGAQAGAALAERARAADLENAAALAKIEAAEKAKLGTVDAPRRRHFTTVDGSIISLDPETGESRVEYTSPLPRSRTGSLRPPSVTVSGLPISTDPNVQGKVSGPISDNYIRGLMGTNAPAINDPLGILGK